ncbi:MAG TPA: hypothetical protein VLA56_02065 [Pseudomonadales bacterium]|nr:hypothetical protein [Pseudomonadales bacterium]
MSTASSLHPAALLALALAVLNAMPAAARAAQDPVVETSGRVKAFASRSFLPDDDLLRFLDGTPRDQASLDLRLAARVARGAVEGEIAWELLGRHDSAGVAGGGLTGTGLAGGADGRLMDLTGRLVSTAHGSVEHRLDRLWGAVRLGEWRLAAGRQAASFGNGLVFQPMDLFNPFSPTEIDRDFKRGEDMLQLGRPFDDGSEIGLLLVGRRGAGDGLDGSEGSAALRHRRFVGALSMELIAGEHLGDPLLAAGFSGPLGTAVWRLDLVTQREGGEVRVSGVANLDWSLVVAARNVYLFAEFYRNGFGLADPTLAGLAQTPGLRRRVQRGEVFTLGRHYVAAGGAVEWHPLLNQQLLLIRELQDGSHLLQTTLAWNPTDSQTWQFSLVAPLGGRGEEFGRLEAGQAGDGTTLTLGGGERVLVRWSLYF